MKSKDTYRIECIDDNEIQRLRQVAAECVSKIDNAIQELRQNVTMGFNNPPQAVYYIKDILGIPLRRNQIEAGVAETSGKTEESYYLSFIPMKTNASIIDLKITDHIRQENYSDAIDNKEHPNVRANTIITGNIEGEPKTKHLPIHKANGVRIRRIEQKIPIAFMGASNSIINNLEVLKQLFIKGSFGKYKKKGNNGSTTPSSPLSQPSLQELKQHKHMIKKITESQLRSIIAESIKTALYEMEQEFTDIQRLSKMEIRQLIDENWVDFEEIIESWLYECKSWEININKPQYSVSNCNKDKADEILMALCNIFHINLNTLSGIVRSIKSTIATMNFMSDNNNLLFAAHYVVLKEIRCVNALIEKINNTSPFDKREDIEDWEMPEELNEDIAMGQRVYIFFMDIPKVQSILKNDNVNHWALKYDSIYKSYPCYIKHTSRYKDGGIRENQLIAKYCANNGIRYKVM